jgi:methylglutaconyl-CoA hydratase
MSSSVPGREPAFLRVSVERGVATLTLDSPHNRNALSSALVAQLGAALAGAVADDAVRVIVLSHTGPVFCSGADLKETAATLAAPADPGAEAAPPLPVVRLAELLAAIWECPKPVVARVAGPSRAGGLGLIAAADIAVCTTDATFAFTEVRLGVIPSVISATVLRRLTPRAAAELYLTGELFDGVRAEAAGLVTVAVAAEHLDAAVARMTASLVRGAPGALAAAKELLRRPEPASMRDELTELAALSARFFASTEGREGIAARMENRDPSWVPRD